MYMSKSSTHNLSSGAIPRQIPYQFVKKCIQIDNTVFVFVRDGLRLREDRKVELNEKDRQEKDKATW